MDDAYLPGEEPERHYLTSDEALATGTRTLFEHFQATMAYSHTEVDAIYNTLDETFFELDIRRDDLARTLVMCGKMRDLDMEAFLRLLSEVIVQRQNGMSVRDTNSEETE